MMSRAISSEVFKTLRIRRKRDLGIEADLAAASSSGSFNPLRFTAFRRAVFVGFTWSLSSPQTLTHTILILHMITGHYRAVSCMRLEGPSGLQIQFLPRGPLGPGEVRVAICAAGVNFPDLLMTRGAYQYKPPPPFVPGMEAAGVVVETSANVGEFRLGQQVAINTRTGLFAAEAVVPAHALVPAPPGFSSVETACLLVAARTARHALVDRAQTRPGETVLVLGAGGGVGLAAVEIARLLGARVIAAASSDEKLRVAMSRGAELAINYTGGDLVEQARAMAPDGIDVIFDPVGGDLFEQALRLPSWNGRVLIVGFASGRIGMAPANRALIKGFSLLGVRAGEAARRDPSIAARGAQELAAWTAAGHLRPHVSATFPLEQASHALEELAARRVIGRIALIVDEQRE
jgi:NADPH2:quinone reductase